MPPTVALLLCTAFVLFLLRLERQGSPDVSPAMWIPTLWILMIGSRSLAVWFGTSGGNESGSPLDQLALSGLSVAGILVLARRRFDWSSVRRHKWLLVLLAYLCVSTLWSDIPFVALKRWVREAIVVIVALVTISEANPLQALASILRRSAYVLIPYSLVLIKYYPALGRQYGRYSGIQMWTGVATQKNELGRLCMISIFFLLWALYCGWGKRPSVGARHQRWADFAIILVALFVFNGANSSTSLATFFVGVATFLSLRLLRKLKIMVPQAGLVALIIFLIGFAGSAPFLGGSNLATFSSSLGRDETLTGRTEVWAAVVPVVKTQLLLGAGCGSFWTDARRDLYDIPTAHNGYLDILLELGAVGLALYVLWLLSCARQFRLALAQDYDWASLGICFLLMTLVYNATESALNTLSEHMTAVLILVSLVVPVASVRGRTSTARITVEFERTAIPVSPRYGKDVWWLT